MRLRIVSTVLVLVVVAVGFVVWKRSTMPESPATGMLGAGGESAGDMSAPPAQDPGVKWQTPKRWAEEPATGMRLATYVVPSPAGGGEAARCPVYYFGPGEGGGIEANIERWIAEFENAGKPRRRDFDVRGIKVAEVEVSGTFQSHAGAEQGAAGSSVGWTLIGAIAEGPGGAVFFKLAGPTATVTPAVREFEEMLASLRKK